MTESPKMRRWNQERALMVKLFVLAAKDGESVTVVFRGPEGTIRIKSKPLPKKPTRRAGK